MDSKLHCLVVFIFGTFLYFNRNPLVMVKYDYRQIADQWKRASSHSTFMDGQVSAPCWIVAQLGLPFIHPTLLGLL